MAFYKLTTYDFPIYVFVTSELSWSRIFYRAALNANTYIIKLTYQYMIS